MDAKIPKFLQIKIYIHRLYYDEFIMFVRLGLDRIWREEVRCANGNTTVCCEQHHMSAGVWQRFLNNQSAVHLQTWY
jgi:hypothetical protein